jgi:hypothetical protein
MLWVDHVRYYGPDRRERRLGLRLNERWRKTAVTDPPAVRTALRHLKVRVAETDQPAGMEAFCRRARSVALLANAYAQRPVGDVLMNLVRKLETSARPGADLRAAIFAQVERAESLLGPT